MYQKIKSTLSFFFLAGYEWVGWRNDTLGMAGKPVEMTFEFDQVRNFSAVMLHTNNMFSKDVQVSWDSHRRVTENVINLDIIKSLNKDFSSKESPKP